MNAIDKDIVSLLTRWIKLNYPSWDFKFDSADPIILPNDKQEYRGSVVDQNTNSGDCRIIGNNFITLVRNGPQFTVTLNDYSGGALDAAKVINELYEAIRSKLPTNLVETVWETLGTYIQAIGYLIESKPWFSIDENSIDFTYILSNDLTKSQVNKLLNKLIRFNGAFKVSIVPKVPLLDTQMIMVTLPSDEFILGELLTTLKEAVRLLNTKGPAFYEDSIAIDPACLTNQALIDESYQMALITVDRIMANETAKLAKEQNRLLKLVQWYFVYLTGYAYDSFQINEATYKVNPKGQLAITCHIVNDVPDRPIIGSYLKNILDLNYPLRQKHKDKVNWDIEVKQNGAKFIFTSNVTLSQLCKWSDL